MVLTLAPRLVDSYILASLGRGGLAVGQVSQDLGESALYDGSFLCLSEGRVHPP